MALTAIAPVMPVVLLAILAYGGHGRQLAEAAERAERRALMLSEHIARIVEVEGQFLSTMDAVARTGADLSPILRAHAQRNPIIVSANLVDPNGNLVASSVADPGRINIAHLPYFGESLGSAAIVVGPAILDPVSGEEMFTISRRRAAPEQGVLVIGIKTAYLSAVFASALQKDAFDGIASVVRRDGTVLVRHPGLGQAMRLTPASGLMRNLATSDMATYRSHSEIDGQDRIFSYHRIGSWPLYLNYGIDVDVVMEPWRREMSVYVLMAVAGSAALIAVAVLVWRQEQAEATMAQELRAMVAERTAEAERRAEDAERATRDKEAALRVAERASSQKSHFLAAASHDLRQPAQALRLFLETMKIEAKGDKQRRIAELASESLRGMEDLLQTLLDVSVLEAGTATMSMADVALRPLFIRIRAEFAPLAEAKGLELIVVDTSATVYSDPVHLDRILRNLVSNAIKYTPTGRVLLGMRRLGPEMRIEVWDTGIGIAEDAIERIFDDFYQINNEARNRQFGLGLGLGIVRRTADLLGHRLLVRSRPGKGSIFALAVRPAPARLGAPPDSCLS